MMNLTEEEEKLKKLLQQIDQIDEKARGKTNGSLTEPEVDPEYKTPHQQGDFELLDETTELNDISLEDEVKLPSKDTGSGEEHSASDNLPPSHQSPSTQKGGKKEDFAQKDFSSSLFLGTKRFIGVDIGSSSLKYVEIRKTRKGWELSDYGVEALPVHGPDIATAAEQKRTLTTVIKKTLPAEKIKSAWVTVSLSGWGVSMRRLGLPKIPKKELKESLFWALRKELPFPVEEAIFDYKILDETREKGTSKFDILLIAAQRNLVEARLSLLAEVKIVPRKLTTPALALWNILLQSPLEIAGKSIVMIDLGAENTTIVFVNDRKAVFAREIGIGGNILTEALTGTIFFEDGQVNLSPAHAERIKVKYGIPTKGSLMKVADGIPLSEIAVAIRPALERLLDEIQRSLDYYRDKFSSDKIEHIYLCGGTARLRNIAAYFSESLGTEVEVYDPLKGLTIAKTVTTQESLRTLAPQLTVALGIAMDHSKELNLLPEDLERLPRIHLQRRILAYGMTSALLILSLFSGFGSLQSKSLKGELQRLEAEYSKMQPRRQKYLELRSQITSLQKKRELYSSEIKFNSGAAVILKAISHLVPENIVLTALTLKPRPLATYKENSTGEKTAKEKAAGRFVRLQGVVLKRNFEEGVTLADFMSTLINSGIFSSVKLQGPVLSERSNYDQNSRGLRFDILCQLQG